MDPGCRFEVWRAGFRVLFFFLDGLKNSIREAAKLTILGTPMGLLVGLPVVDALAVPQPSASHQLGRAGIEASAYASRSCQGLDSQLHNASGFVWWWNQHNKTGSSPWLTWLMEHDLDTGLDHGVQ